MRTFSVVLLIREHPSGYEGHPKEKCLQGASKKCKKKKTIVPQTKIIVEKGNKEGISTRIACEAT
jgi:hypothetical protein